MNGISSYSLWWLLIQRDWYYYQGDLDYLKEQQDYLTALLGQLISRIDKKGVETLDGTRFLDWPSNENPEAINAGLQALMLQAMQAGEELALILYDPTLAEACRLAGLQLRKGAPKVTVPLLQNAKPADAPGQKQAAALLALAGLMEPETAAESFLIVNGPAGFSTFYGYYMLRALAEAGYYQEALDIIRQYWGAMLDLGATTFWEDFNMEWLPDASPIDELVPASKKDIHGDYGNYCYKGFRHSLCHGWASGPTAWLSEYVLGVQVLEPGCSVVGIRPNLGDLEWAEGTFPTPYGVIFVRHEKQADGTIVSEIQAPEEIEIRQD